jgi:hypothetical protein
MNPVPHQILSAQACRKRWGLLGLCSMPLLGAIPYSQGYRLPLLGCPLLHLTGIPCPTCGMTRSFTAVVQGHWEQAVQFHLFGPLLFLFFMGVVLHLAVELKLRRRLVTCYTRLVSRRDLQFLAVATYLGYYLVRLFIVGYPEDFKTTLSLTL